MNKSIFNGPLFIIGMPRSGTKLLKELINNHSNISLCNEETQFIPGFLRRFNGCINTNRRSNLWKYFKYFKNTSFYTISENNLTFDVLARSINKYDPASFVEYILKYYSGDYESADCSNHIWGDKSPLYAFEIPLLNSFFPDAKFIHIIRDFRDVCLSYNKTWGKSLYSTAEKWRQLISEVDMSTRVLHRNKYYQLNYEKLISNPTAELRLLCDVIGIDFEPDMVKLTKVIEHYGDAKDSQDILSNNYDKFMEALPPSQTKRIERIVGPIALKKGYRIHNSVEHKPLNRFQNYFLLLRDLISYGKHILFEERGVKQGSKYLIRQLKDARFSFPYYY